MAAALGLLVTLAGVAGAGGEALPSLLKALDLRAYAVRVAPPPFSGSALDGRLLSMAEHRGKVIVLNFWATWCIECRSEMPVFERLQREFGPRGLTIVGVNARESKDVVTRYARELGLTFPLVLDPDGRINVLYGVIGLPATFVVGRDGRAIAFAIGAREWQGTPARALIQALLEEPVPGSSAR